MSDIPWTERELRRLMVKACAALAQKNLVSATDGNVSARLSPDRVLVMLTQHGAVTVGKDPWAAYLRMEKLEHFSQILKAAAEIAGGTDGIKRLNNEQIEALKASYGKGKLSRAVNSESAGSDADTDA